MPSHVRMRGFDRDLIRGGHYGQRSCEPHKQAEHMAAPISMRREVSLANSEPSTHGTTCRLPQRSGMSAIGAKADLRRLPLK